MEISLLETKLYIPSIRPVLVSRSRLLDRLQEGLGYSLVLISAPAGFGKTTLLGEWAKQSSQRTRTAWLSLDEGDSDPVRFWDYFIAALQKLQPGCGAKFLPWLHSSQPPSTESMLTALINELSAVKDDFVIVLDDYHFITTQQIHGGITYFIEHLPAHIHLVIASRADPPLPLARFRGKGIMLEIHTDDLRFTQDDTTSLLKELKTPALTAKDIIALDERTEGWAVGLKMAALSLKGHKDVPGFVAAFTGSQRYIMDYLMEEVLQKQSQEIRDFLMKTSILERLTGPLCDYLTKRKDSQEILLNLERDHLFIVLLDESRQWYRYEHLFADLLRYQCETVYGKEQVTALHRQASQWYEDNALPDEAINHSLAARGWERAIRLISTLYEERRILGEFETLLRWLKTIPDETLREHLRLYSQYAILLAFRGQVDEAEAVLGYLETATLDDTTRGEAAFAQGLVYRHRGDTRRCIEQFEKSFKLLPQDDVVIRSIVAVNAAQALHRIGSLQEAERWATLAYELGQQIGDISVVAGALNQLGIITAYQGKLNRAVELWKKSDELTLQTAWEGNQGLLCMTYYNLNDLEAAAENARLSIERGELTDGMGAVILGSYYQALVYLARGDVTGADAAMEKMDLASHHPSIDTFWYANYIASRIMYAIRRDNLQEAGRWGEQLPDIDSMIAIDRYVPARLLLAQGKREEAARLLQELYDSFVRSGHVLLVRNARIYQALASDTEEKALEFLDEALTMAEPGGVIRPFVDEGKLLKPLLEKTLAQKVTPGFTRKLLDIIEAEDRQRQARQRTTASLPSSLLSEREIEVIKLLANEVSNQHIAEQLCISLSTVKTHVHHVIDKLEVKDRRQAVQRAKDLKLI
ncbi:LuxR C-terminal-related transcriptional regulator [Chloroflexota bacterium]